MVSLVISLVRAFSLFLLGYFFAVCHWQLEIISWCRDFNVVYNFAGLIEDATINLWSWRDFWFLMQLVTLWLALVVVVYGKR